MNLGSRFGWIWLLLMGGSAGAEFPREHVEFFERSVRPMLAEKCVECHGRQRAELGLRLDTREGILEGSHEGKVVKLGDPLRSSLLRAVKHEGEAAGIANMPEEGGKLSAEEIAVLEKWLQLGMPWPERAVVEADRDLTDHWSFRPVAKQEVPEGAHPVDHWVRRKLREQKLAPAPRADGATLVRRLYFDLVGLPPSYEELKAWRDKPTAALIDHLLASPHYGERWGRHWLDVARYSDVKGYEAGGRERRFVYSYTYRDWVIRALNEDMPYDQFILYQLAAEQLAGEADKRHLAAMGFLTLARKASRKELVIDDQIDTTFRGLMGLTVSCARCHDHKFDPVPTRDYYSLFGVFANSQAPGEAPLLREPQDTPGYRRFLEEKAKLEQKVADFLNPKLKEAAQQHPNLANRPFQLEGKLNGDDKRKLRNLRIQVDKHEANSPHAPDRALILRDLEAPRPQYVYLRGNPASRGEKVERQFLSLIAGEEAPPFQKGSGRLELAQAIVDPDNPLTARVLVNRVWYHHFGEGLVSTPSDFGHQGELPSHPELLDWLAAWFVEQGWSLKKLHRLILTSATWQQASVHPKAEAQQLIDPENRLLWKTNRRRLDFESMRDSVLALDGTLNRKLYGRSVRIEQEPYPFRRTVYAFVNRQNLPSVFTTFDFASPQAHAAKRPYTTVPTQALFSLNHPFMQQHAGLLVKRANLANHSSVEQKVRALFRTVLSRDPEPFEIQLGKAYVAQQTEELSSDPLARNPQSLSPWQYGYQRGNEQGEPEFVAMSVFQDNHRWQPEETYPLEKNPLSHLHFRKGSGHPGASLQHAAVVQWTAPEDVEIEVKWQLRKPSKNGDPVRGRLWRGEELLMEMVIEPEKELVKRSPTLSVRRGERLQFCFDSFQNHNYDQFEWWAKISELPSGSVRWDSSEDFRGPHPKASEWESYAQALMLTNEFLFVD